MSLYTTNQRKLIVSRATEIVKARQNGKTSIVRGGQKFDLEQGGFCNRFIRQVVETALTLSPFSWYFGDTTARRTLDKLEPYKLEQGTTLQAGDIIGWYDGSGPYGHIALYIGTEKKLIAENTSATRGDPKPPGTKVTRLANCRTGWKAYRLFPTEG